MGQVAVMTGLWAGAFSKAPAARLLDGAFFRLFSGFVLQSDGLETLKRAIWLVSEGGTFYSPALGSILLERLDIRVGGKGDGGGSPVLLTLKERQVLALICQEYSTKEISKLLGMELSTVNTHRKHLMEKTGARNMVGLVRYAVKMGVIS